jgi:hypothetical protein
VASDPTLVVARVVQALEAVNATYWVGGSLASSSYGIPRATQDVDLVADLRSEQAAPFVAALADEFYVDAESVADAIRRRASFNVVHLATMYKADVFIMQASPWARIEAGRRRLESLSGEDETVRVYLSSPEDVILHKLEWYRLGGGVSDRQWGDVLGVLKVQGEALDFGYLRQWAGELGLTELLAAALRDAGLKG